MRHASIRYSVALVASLALMGQAPSPPATATQAATAATPKPAAAPKSAPSKCMRLPLSDIAFEREPTIAQTRMRLNEYAEAERRKRGWGTLAKSRETIECDVYLVVPFLGTEYKCLITATFCAK